MALERINPDDLATPQTYTHVIVATASRLVFVAGQVADDDQGLRPRASAIDGLRREAKSE
jgi:enamine deaminase RidA (YjgF/YER057c/UK114 family)